VEPGGRFAIRFLDRFFRDGGGGQQRPSAGERHWRPKQMRSSKSQGSILVGVLWCLALLSVIVIGVLHTARMDLKVVKNYGDRIQAHYLALAGVEKAKALLLQDAMERRRTGKNHTGALYDAPEEFRDISLGRGEFRVFRHGSQDEGGGTIYGISDQESRLNV